MPAVHFVQKSNGFRTDIEGLRGIAILLVVAFHAQIRGLQGGFVGVDIFFVLSGYLISTLLVNEVRDTGRLDFAKFYARRARRLLPASSLMLLVTICVSCVIYSPLEQKHLSKTAQATAAYASNFSFMREASDYFGPETATNPLLHTWSLAVEEQFYLVWPVLIVLGIRRKKSVRWLLFVIAVISALSVASFVILSRVNEVWAFFGSPPRAWEFGLGGMASFVSTRTVHQLGPWSRRIVWTGLFFIVLASTLSSDTAFLPFAIIVPVLATAAVLICGVCEPSANFLLRSRVLQRIGKLSYSWYLWHWPVLVLAALLLPRFSPMARILCVSGSLVLAAITNRIVENPIRFNPYLSRRNALTLCLTLVLTATTLGVSAFWGRYVSHLSEYRRFASVQEDLPELYRDGCHAELRESQARECVFGTAMPTSTVVLFGDSHAAEWFPAMKQIANNQNWRLITLTHSSCPASDLPTFDAKLRRPVPECRAWRLAAIARILAIRPTLVVIGQSSKYDESPGKPLSYEQWKDGTRKTLATLNQAHLQTILLRDSPQAGFDVLTCLARSTIHHGNTCSLSRDKALNNSVFKAETDSTLGLDHVSVLDLSDRICGASICEPVTDDGLIVYRDENHLTTKFVETLVPALTVNLVSLIPH